MPTSFSSNTFISFLAFFSLTTMSKLYFLLLLLVVVSALDPPREGHHGNEFPHTRQPHNHFTFPNGNSPRPTMGIHQQHGRKDDRFRMNPHSFGDHKNWQQVKILSDYLPQNPNLIRNRREQIRKRHQ